MDWRNLFLGSILLALHHHTAVCSKRSYYDYISDYDINTLPGVAGVDYPALAEVPANNFYCEGKMAGYYADPNFGCQVYHKCDIDHRKDSFLCSNGTVFNQKTFVCEWWYSVDCSKSHYYYELNSRLYKTPYSKTPSMYQDSKGIVYISNSPIVAQSSFAKPSGDLLFATFFKDIKLLASGQSEEVSKEKPLTYKSISEESASSSLEYPAVPNVEDNSAAVPETKPTHIKVYKAKPVSEDGKAKVTPMDDSKESYE